MHIGGGEGTSSAMHKGRGRGGVLLLPQLEEEPCGGTAGRGGEKALVKEEEGVLGFSVAAGHHPDGSLLELALRFAVGLLAVPQHLGLHHAHDLPEENAEVQTQGPRRNILKHVVGIEKIAERHRNWIQT